MSHVNLSISRISNDSDQVGLQAEEVKSPGEGAGLCPGYTISKAILSDAVCLTRGDRFYTIDYTRKQLNNDFCNLITLLLRQRPTTLYGGIKTLNMTEKMVPMVVF